MWPASCRAELVVSPERVRRRHVLPDVVVGAGHNGLVAACYLSQAGRDVVVVEQLDRPGGGSRTEETVP
ncbi:MAG: FAD-dependent oxidoreductase, partial [Actinomycetota bacterium]|nr:FAD-dependent oxidoreductase [Actinomycetota bacterium]